MSSDTTVLFTNNYSMPDARDAWIAGREPGHHLCGAPQLEAAGYQVRYLPHHPVGGGRIAAAGRSRFGALRTELQAWRHSPGGICYSADPFSYAGLALLRSQGRTRHKVVANIHPKAVRSRLRDTELRAYDGCVALSRIVHRELVEDLGRSADRTRWLPWGPDLAFPGYVSRGEDAIVCTGKTNRDHATLLAALARLGFPARVHVQVEAASPGPHIEVLAARPYSEVLSDLQRAAVVAIPLLPLGQLAGITELNDALALAKPIVMTRSAYIDVDVTAVGCGFVVEPGDVAGWASALDALMSDPALRAQMGQRGRAFAEKEWNAEIFGRGVVDLMNEVCP